MVALAAALALVGGYAMAEAKAWSLKEAAPYAGTTINMICQAYTPCDAIEVLAPEFTEETGISATGFVLLKGDGRGCEQARASSRYRS